MKEDDLNEKSGEGARWKPSDPNGFDVVNAENLPRPFRSGNQPPPEDITYRETVGRATRNWYDR